MSEKLLISLNQSLNYGFLIKTVVDGTHCTRHQGMSFLLPLYDWLEDYQGVQSKAADVGSKRPMFGRKWPMSKRPMLGPKWPMFGPKQPMFHRPLFWPKVADVV